MSTISEITDVLNRLPRGNNDGLALQESSFSNPQVKVFFEKALDGNALVIDHATISPPDAKSVSVKGQGSVLGYGGLATQLTFQLPDGGDELDIRLRGDFDPQKAISLPLIQWLALHKLAVETEVKDEFGIVSTRMYGSLKLEGVDDIPVVLSRTGQSEWSLNIAQDKPVALPDLNHLAQLMGGQKVPIYVQGSAGGSTQWMVAISPDDRIVLPSLYEILKFAGGQDFASSLPSGFSAIPAIAVRQLIIEFDPAKRAVNLIRFAIGTAQPW